MKATETLLNTFLSQNKTQFIIPVYQRNYDWAIPQCRLLLHDIIATGEASNTTHFIGSIVYIHDGVFVSSEVKPLVIIDGQQRLTTLTILYMALYEFAKSSGNAEKAEEIQDTYLMNKYVKDDLNKLKLKQSAENYKAFRFIVTGNAPESFEGYSHVVENFSFFRQSVNAENFTKILDGLSRLVFVEVSLERGKDDPQRIFESLNSTGLDLSQADLIRNYILMGLDPAEQERIFELHWEHIESNAKDEELSESRVSDFIRDYLTIKSRKISVKGKVYEEFKNKYRSRDAQFYSQVMPELKAFSMYYHTLINPGKETDEQIRTQLKYIKLLEINVSFPFLLQVLHDFKSGRIKKEELLQVLELVHTYSWRRFIAGLPTNALNKVFMNLYSDIDYDAYVLSVESALARKKGVARFPSDQDILDVFAEKDMYSIHAKNRLYYFERLENYNNKETVSLEHKNITVEHIFPQNPEAGWDNELSPEEYALFKDKYLNTPGNLTLSGNNSSLSNSTFAKKKSMNVEGKEQGYAFSRLWINRQLSTLVKWDVSAYKERTKMIEERFLTVWPGLTVEGLEEVDLDEDYTIYDAPDPTNRRLDYFIFRDEKIETEEISKMYYHVLRVLMNENPALFHHPEIRSIISYSTTPKELRTAVVLQEPYYIEANISSKAKFSVLRQVLERFGCEEDLLINFANGDVGKESGRDLEYWKERVPETTIVLLDNIFQLARKVHTNIEPKYNAYYLGCLIDGKTQNFMLLMPKQEFVRLAVYCSDVDATRDKLSHAGIGILSVGIRSKRLKFRLTPELFAQHKELILELIKDSYAMYFRKS